MLLQPFVYFTRPRNLYLLQRSVWIVGMSETAGDAVRPYVLIAA